MPNDPSDITSRFDEGMRVRRAVLGADYVDRVMAAQTAFDAPFQFLGELFTSTGKDFDAVVLERVVRGRNHHAGGVAHARRQVGDCRCGNDPRAR